MIGNAQSLKSRCFSWGCFIGTFLFQLCQITGLIAQNFTGLQNSNFSGTHVSYSNPALLTDMPYHRYANLMTVGVDVNNTMVALEAPFTAWQAVNGNVPSQYLNSRGRVKWRREFLQIQKNPYGWAYLGLEWRGPAYARRIGKHLVWSMASRTRCDVAINNIPNELTAYVLSLLDSSQKNPFQFAQLLPFPFSIQANAYQEFTASFAGVIVDTKKIKISIGATGKYLMGLGHFSAASSGLQLAVFGRDSIVIFPSQLSLAYSETNFLKRFVSGTLVGGLPSFSSVLGHGFGCDLGLSVEGGKGSTVSAVKSNMLDIVTTRNYRWRMSAALLDLGNVNYRRQIKRYQVSNAAPVTLLLDSAFNMAFEKGGDDGLQFVEQFARSHMNFQENVQMQGIGLPTQLQFNGDWHVKSGLYCAMQWRQSLITIQSKNFRRPSSLSIIPRIETRWVEVSMPLSLEQDYRKPTIGTYLRVGPVFVGSDNVISLLKSNNVKAFNLYFGLSSTIGKGRR